MTGTSADCRRGVMEGKREKGERRFNFSIFQSYIYSPNFIKSIMGPLILRTFQRFLVKLGLFLKVVETILYLQLKEYHKTNKIFLRKPSLLHVFWLSCSVVLVHRSNRYFIVSFFVHLTIIFVTTQNNNTYTNLSSVSLRDFSASSSLRQSSLSSLCFSCNVCRT